MKAQHNREIRPSIGVPGFFWANQDEWNDVHTSLARLFSTHQAALGGVYREAELAASALKKLFPFFDDLTARVCHECRGICCVEARVAYDFRDLVFLHALNLDIPPHQLRRHDGEHCRYFSAQGCTLDRLRRPFICTWFYCSPMLDHFYRLPNRTQRHYSQLMMSAQNSRKVMEDDFIRTVADRVCVAF